MSDTNKCFICGKEGSFIEHLPHGQICVCQSKCLEILTLKINNDAYPVVWVSRDDIHNEDEDEDQRRMPKEDYDTLESEEIIRIASDTANALGDYFWNSYDDALKTALFWRKERVELKMIKNTPDEDLPLLIGKIEFESNKRFFENRLKGK